MLPLQLIHKHRFNAQTLIHAVKSLHQPAFLACSLILMKNALCGGFI